MDNPSKFNLPKSLIRSLYDVQGQRIQTGNRICAEVKVRLGQAPNESEKVLPAEAKEYLDGIRAEFKRISDAFALKRPSSYLKVNYEKYKIITDAAMLLFGELYTDHLKHEARMESIVKVLVKKHPLWNYFLKDVHGIGPLMSAVCLCEFDIYKAPRISNFWSYAGLDVAADGRGRGKTKDHLVDQKYIDKDGVEQTKKGITYNPFLKTKLVGVLGSCFVRSSPDKCKYRRIYDDYKHRLENHEVHKLKTKGHIHAMAVRYMVKMFVQDLWLAWREMEGLPVTRPYHEAMLGHEHGK